MSGRVNDTPVYTADPGRKPSRYSQKHDNGALFDRVFKARPAISGEDAFELYDTMGSRWT